MRAVESNGRTWRWRGAIAAAALLCALWAAAFVQREVARGAEGDGCDPSCVILIQVDGLEPKDVTEETTPYLWRLAHPRVQGRDTTGTALAGRSGWIWQAPRGVVGTGTAPATASLLTGGFPEMTGVPADDFYGLTQSGDMTRQRLGAGGFGDSPVQNDPPDRDAAAPLSDLPIDTVMSEVRNKGGDAAAFVGDPGLARLAAADASPYWYPPGTGTTDSEPASASEPVPQYTGDPRLCPIARFPDRGAGFETQFENDPPQQGYDPRYCPANDMTTMSKAAEDLVNPEYASVGFTFIHLAELGVAKRLSGDTDTDRAADEAPPQPAHALAQMDAAIAAFVERYAAQGPGGKWDKTVVMVVGTHGYQRTPITNRVPDIRLPSDTDPAAAAWHLDPTRDLSDLVSRYGDGSFRLVSQGTMATVYYKPGVPGVPATERAAALAGIKAQLQSNELQAACALRNPALPDCIKQVYYVDRDVAGAGKTVEEEYPDWRLDARDPEVTDRANAPRTGASGDLVVELGRGWAFGRAAGLPYQATVEGRPMTNPYTASSGGPQERAVAALINGPGDGQRPGAVRDLDTYAGTGLGTERLQRFPVSKLAVPRFDADNPPPVPNDPACPEDDPTDPGGLHCANDPEEVARDANMGGHEAQPETVDFATTVSALMQLPFANFPYQLQGRVLQEAFVKHLSRPCFENCEGDIVEVQDDFQEEVLPAPPVEVTRPREFFSGLVRGLKARVVDSRGNAYGRARPGTLMSTIRVEGDFGKPEAAVTLTFYRRVASTRRSAARRSRVVRLKPIARFDPFVVKRGHATMRLKIPPLFKPTYLGLTVRQISRVGGARRRTGGQPCTRVKLRKPVPFRCTGPRRALIVPIADANRLHKRKPVRAAPRRRR